MDLANEENPLVFYNQTTGRYFDFIGNNEPNIGHLDGLLSTSNSLFIADLSSNGDLFTSQGTGAGVIYEIQAVNPAPNVATAVTARHEHVVTGKAHPQHVLGGSSTKTRLAANHRI